MFKSGISRMDMKYRQLAGTIFIVTVIAMAAYVIERVTATDAEIHAAINTEAFVDAGRCGVDLPSCVGERVRCINGYCKSDRLVAFPELSDIPMLPPARY